MIPIAIVGGVVAATAIGSKTYVAETILLYKPGPWATADDEPPPSLKTRINLIKLRENLASIRERLNLPATIESLGAAITVLDDPNTDLLRLQGAADSAQSAAELANTTRDVFLEDQRGGPGTAATGDGAGLAMPFDHRRIAATALGRLRGKFTYRPVVFELLAAIMTRPAPSVRHSERTPPPSACSRYLRGLSDRCSTSSSKL